MRRSTVWVLLVILGLVLSGCVSDRAASPDPTAPPEPTIPTAEATGGGLPTLPPPTGEPATPMPEQSYRAPSQPDSDMAIPRDYLEDLGLVPYEVESDTFYQVAEQFYDGTVLFRNDWKRQEGVSTHFVYVREARYVFPSAAEAEAFAQNINRGSILEMQDSGAQAGERFLDLGDTSFVSVFTWPDQDDRVYTAQFTSGQTAVILIVAGDGELTQAQAFDIFSLAARSGGQVDPAEATPAEVAGEFDRLVGDWSRRQAYVTINPHGTGVMQWNSGCCTGITYGMVFDMRSSPVTATIVDISTHNTDPSTFKTPKGLVDVGDTVTFLIEARQGVDVLVITVENFELSVVAELEVCRNGGFDSPCAW